ncbi:MAG: glutathione synthase [Methylococcaceae bacterium]
MKKVRLGIVMDPVSNINIDKDTTFALMIEAQSRHWDLFYMELEDLYLSDSKANGRLRPISVQRDASNWYQFGDEVDTPLDFLDAILMRKDPPFNLEYIYATYILEQAENQGTLVVNKPQALRDANEKLFTAWFPECCTPTLVTRNSQQILRFLQEHEDIIVKPLDGMGGSSIFRITKGDPNTNVILETMTAYNKKFTMIQKYLPEIKQGDKRVLVINGEPIPYALARIPTQGESRGNLAAGGIAEGRELTARDLWIANHVGPTLRAKGLLFVGLDIIGDYLTEINVTSPTCVQELDKYFNINISAKLIDCIEEQI